MKNNMSRKVFIAMVLAMVAHGAFSQLADLEKPAPNLTEKWTTNSSGWGVVSAASTACGWTNGTLAINCLPQSFGDGFQSVLKLTANLSASGGIFLGDYSKIEAVTFDVQPNGMTLSPSFYFKSISGKEWRYPFLGLCVDGQKKNVNIPFLSAENWSGFRGADFNSDKTNIIEVGFEFIRGQNDLKSQDFSVDNLKLIGPWAGPYSNGVPLAWVIENGLTNNFGAVGLLDSDNDSFSNAAEFLAGTDPVNSNSFFKIDIVKNSQGKMVVRWTGNRGVNFKLLEANSLGADGQFITKTNISPATVKTEEVVVDQAGDGAKFYKVMITTNLVGP